MTESQSLRESTKSGNFDHKKVTDVINLNINYCIETGIK